MDTKKVTSGMAKTLAHLLFKAFLLLFWCVVKLCNTIINRLQAAIETYLQKSGK